MQRDNRARNDPLLEGSANIFCDCLLSSPLIKTKWLSIETSLTQVGLSDCFSFSVVIVSVRYLRMWHIVHASILGSNIGQALKLTMALLIAL